MNRPLTIDVEARIYIYLFWLSYFYALGLFRVVGRLKGS